jgi:hypothetical protein
MVCRQILRLFVGAGLKNAASGRFESGLKT